MQDRAARASPASAQAGTRVSTPETGAILIWALHYWEANGRGNALIADERSFADGGSPPGSVPPDWPGAHAADQLRANSSEESDLKGKPIRPPAALTSGVRFAFSASTVPREPATQGRLGVVEQSFGLSVRDIACDLEADVYCLERGVPLLIGPLGAMALVGTSRGHNW